jgi:hypothetical protein
MHSFFGRCATLYNPTQIHPVLNSLADECCGMLARLVAYVGALALLAIVGVHLWDECRSAKPLRLPSKRAGAWPRARTRPLPSVSSI